MHTQVRERSTESVTVVTRRRIVVAAIVFLGGLAILFVVLAWKWPFTQQAVIAPLQDQLGSVVQIGSFRQTYFPHPGCVADNVTFRRNATAPALITIQKLTIVGSYHGLLSHHLTTVRADGFRLVITKGAAPESLSGIGRTTAGLTIGELIADGAQIEFPAQQQGKQPLIFRIPKLILRDVGDSRPLNFDTTVHLGKPSADVDVTGNFGPWQVGHAGQTRLSGYYAVRNLDLGVFGGVAGQLAAKGNVDGILQHLKLQGTVDAPTFEVRESRHPVHLAAEFAATVDGLNGDVDIDAARVHFLKTTIVGTGSISAQSGQNGKTAVIELSSSKARIQDLLWLFVSDNPPNMAGPIVFRGKATIPPGQRPFLQKLELQGDFGISNAQYPNPQTQKDIDVLSARARGQADLVEDTNEKRGNNSFDPGRVLSNLKGHVAMKNTIAHLTDVSFDVPGASTRVSGTYNLQNERIDLRGHMHLDADLSKTTTGVKSILLKVFEPFMHKGRRHESVVAISIGGTYGHPTYSVVPRAEK